MVFCAQPLANYISYTSQNYLSGASASILMFNKSLLYRVIRDCEGCGSADYDKVVRWIESAGCILSLLERFWAPWYAVREARCIVAGVTGYLVVAFVGAWLRRRYIVVDE